MDVELDHIEIKEETLSLIEGEDNSFDISSLKVEGESGSMIQPTYSDHVCEYCNKSFKHKSALKRHIVKHTHEKTFVCSLCNRKFGNNSHRMRHHRSVHKGMPLPPDSCMPRKINRCTQCRRLFTDGGKLKDHVARVHTKIREFNCPQCPQSFFSNSHLNRHVRLHDTNLEKPYECGVCGHRFLERFNLMVHKRIHTDEMPYSCAVCHKSFRTNSTLRTHEMIHTGEKRHSCPECSKAFIKKSTLNRHLIVHTGEKLFGCFVCGKHFGTKGHLERHFIGVHSNIALQMFK